MFSTFLVERCQTILYSCGVWIGGTDQNTESEFIWSRSGNKITFTQWSIGNPKNFLNEDCIEIHASNGEWNDRTCDSTISFICEKKLIMLRTYRGHRILIKLLRFKKTG